MPGCPRYAALTRSTALRGTDREEGEIHLTTQMKRLTQISGCMAGVFALLLASGCSTKKYVKSQTAPLIQHTNELDDQTATNNRNLKNLDEKTTAGIGKAQSSADSCPAERAAGEHRRRCRTAERAGSSEPRRLTGKRRKQPG